MEEPAVEVLRQLLEAEDKSETVAPIPDDAYTRLASYSQRLKATIGMNGGDNDDDIAMRLAKKQIWLIEVMTKRLLQMRLDKAERGEARSGPTKLLPEEEYIADALADLDKKEERFVKAVVDGQPSFFTLVRQREIQRMVAVRISKPISEIIGADLRKYGPFGVNDVAMVPMGNAKAMLSNGDAVMVSGDSLPPAP